MSTANHFGQALQGPNTPMIYEFGPFILDTFQHALLKEGQPVQITPKTYDMLVVLVHNRGRMLSKEELMKSLWPDSFVEESNLTQQVSMIRRVLGESASNPRYIATVPGRGYRFISEVRIWSTERSNSGSNADLPGARLASISDSISHRSGDHGHSLAATNPAGTLPRLTLVDSRNRRKASQRIMLLVIVGLVVVAAMGLARFWYRVRSTTLAAQVKPRSLAILPLQNLKQDPADDFLGFSLADAVITKLDYVSSVIVRPSAAIEKYRNQVIDIQKVAADLNVDTLLTGSFIRDHDNLRITYQLIDLKSDRFLGRGTIDLKYDDLLRVQDNVSQQIIKELALNLSPAEAERVRLDATVRPLAYEYYLQGVDLHGQHKFPLAIKMLQKSTEIDPNYAPAWAYLGASYNSDAAFEFGGREQYRRAQAAYERALAIQPSQLEAKIFLANLLVDTGKVEEAVPLLRDALKTNPNRADVHWELGYAYRFAGMLDESVAACERARVIDPSVKANGSVLNAYLYLGQYDKFLSSLPEVNDSAFFLFYRGLGEYHQNNWERAAKDFDRAFQLDPTLYTRIGKALSFSIARQNEDGLSILRALEKKITERGVGDPEGTYKAAEAYAILGDKSGALRLLRTSVEGGFFAYPYLVRDPLLDSIRAEPEFAEILEASQRRHQAFKQKFF